MKKTLMIISFFLIQVIGFSKTTECACSNSDDLTIKQVVESSVTFKGKLLTKRTESFPTHGYQIIGVFQIDSLIRGEIEKDTVEIVVGYGSVCNFYFFPKEDFLVLATFNGELNKLETSLCAGNRRLKNLNQREKQLLLDFQKNKDLSEWKDRRGKTVAKGKVLNRMPEGRWEFYNYFNELTKSGNFINGKKEGNWVEFSIVARVCDALYSIWRCDLTKTPPPHPEGWISSRTSYRNGLIHGTVLNFHELGCIESESYFENGIQIGPTITY